MKSVFLIYTQTGCHRGSNTCNVNSSCDISVWCPVLGECCLWFDRPYNPADCGPIHHLVSHCPWSSQRDHRGCWEEWNHSGQYQCAVPWNSPCSCFVFQLEFFKSIRFTVPSPAITDSLCVGTTSCETEFYHSSMFLSVYYTVKQYVCVCV